MNTKPLSFDLIRIDAGTQSRLSINEDTVEDYAEIIRAAKQGEWPFPPLDVFCDGSNYFMADGFHRKIGAERAGRASAPCIVHPGTATDARIFSMTANDKHGVRMTRADKRACVAWLLDHGGKMPQKEIAEKAGVGLRLVQTIVAERNPQSIAGKATPPKQDSKTHNAPSTPISGVKPPASSKLKDYGKCPNCLGTKWDEDEKGITCHKCHHPHGEPAGDVDDKQLTIQRSKTVKTVEALMRAFDDLQDMRPKAEHEAAIDGCKVLIKTAKGWK